MRLVSYATTTSPDAEWRAGFMIDGSVVDASEAAALLPSSLEPGDVASVKRLLALPRTTRSTLARHAGELSGTPLEEVVLGPPVPDPDKFICVGLNYHDHAAESGLEPPAVPTLFAKFRNSLIGSGAPIELPPSSASVDYEGELAVVIGRRCKGVSAADALDVVAGYMVLNDVSARDMQLATPQWTAGKAIDTFAPCGPCLVDADEIGDPQALDLTTRVNGAVVQHASTREMIFGVAQLVEFISTAMTLEVGDVVATGTPAGVGVARRPQLFLGDGDVVEVEIGGIGAVTSPVVAVSR